MSGKHEQQGKLLCMYRSKRNWFFWLSSLIRSLASTEHSKFRNNLERKIGRSGSRKILENLKVVHKENSHVQSWSLAVFEDFSGY